MADASDHGVTSTSPPRQAAGSAVTGTRAESLPERLSCCVNPAMLMDDHSCFAPGDRMMNAKGFWSALALVLPALATSGEWRGPSADSARIQEHLTALSRFGANPEGGVSRVAFSDADIAGRAYVKSLMEAAGLAVRTDALGNLIGRREGTDRKLPAIMLGSHTDSVPHGGNFDGDVGVMGSIEVAQLLRDHRVRLRHALEIVDFVDEEGGLVGSRAMAGELTPATLDLVNSSGRSVRDGIRTLGGNPDALGSARRNRGDLAAYLELHIEQGGILERTHTHIGVVQGIVGIHWWEATITGLANHAGTTPMDQRHDALMAASELVLAVNAAATQVPGRQVATVGQIKAEPGAPNVIPGQVVLSVEVRDLDAAKIASVFERIRARANEIAQARGVTIAFRDLEATATPALTDPRIQRAIDDSARTLGLTTMSMPSGAGHDAQDMAQIAPIGMIFVPSVGGISHSPREYTAPADIANGADVLLRTTLALDAVGALR
jgi:beta-ureidopropionase / N-carbamoyl-L-amino-acid hydrolase